MSQVWNELAQGLDRWTNKTKSDHKVSMSDMSRGVYGISWEWQGYNHIIREHVTVNHGIHEWARDDDGDGIREVHTNTTEGMWTGLRIFLGPFRGVHKNHLPGYIAIHEQAINLKKISPKLMAALMHSN